MNQLNYFEQTSLGESRWWSWLVAFWFTILGWVIAQTVVTSPIPAIIAEIDPEAANQLTQASIALFEDIDLVKFGLLTSGLLLSTLAVIISWIVNRFTSGTAKTIFGWITGISMVASLVCAFILFPMMNDPEANNAFMQMIGLSPVAYALMLATFPATLIGLFLVQKFIHKRSIVSLHTAADRINWMRILYAIAVTWVVYGIVAALFHFTGLSPLQMTFDPTRFFGFAIATLILIPLQSGTEEIVFRGYLNQGFGHFISNKWVVFIITSALFAAMHLSNPEATSGAEKGGLMHLIVMSSYFMFGFIMAVIVYFEDGLEAAIGVHAGNNMFAAMFVNYEGSVLPTPSIFLAKINPSFDVPLGIITMALVAYILYRSRPNTRQTIT